jgi:ribonuclease BN (tRNA processing enzyme)
MRAALLGTGSPPPDPTRRGPATLLSLGDERFLVDAGSGVELAAVAGRDFAGAVAVGEDLAEV